jgi:anti-anti-sigma regulatory factor/PAS domain-containing protein
MDALSLAGLNYLILPIIMLEVGLIVYVLAQDGRATANRVFAAYLVAVTLADASSLIRGTTVNESVATLMTLPLAPLISLSALFLLWLTLALFLPQRFAQPAVRWLIAAPYLVALLCSILDLALGWDLWYAGFDRTAQGTLRLQMRSEFNPLLASLIVAQLVPLVMTATIAVRHPDRRLPAATLFGGILLTTLISAAPQTRGAPVMYNLAPLPTYLALAWITLRYQLFRPTPVALQTALDALPEAIVFLDSQDSICYANQSARRLLDQPALAGGEAFDAALGRVALQAAGQSGRYARPGPPALILEATAAAIPGQRRGLRILTLRDITAAEQQAAVLREQNEEQRRLLELVDVLETPAVTLADNVLFAPIVGYLDHRRAEAFTERLLHEAHRDRIQLVILDITGVPMVDAAVANSLLGTARALRLLGCKVAISGISAATASALVEQDIALAGIRTVRSPHEAMDGRWTS